MFLQEGVGGGGGRRPTRHETAVQLMNFILQGKEWAAQKLREMALTEDETSKAQVAVKRARRKR